MMTFHTVTYGEDQEHDLLLLIRDIREDWIDLFQELDLLFELFLGFFGGFGKAQDPSV